MGRRTHATGMIERQRMRDHTPERTLGGTTFRYECRICGSDHGTDRHTTCPDCGMKPHDFYDGPWASNGDHAQEGRDVPFRTDTTWSSKRMEILD